MARDDRRRGGGGRQIVSAALLLTVVLFFLPALVVRGEPVYRRDGVAELPMGVFGVMTELDKVGRADFREGRASFIFAPVQ